MFTLSPIARGCTIISATGICIFQEFFFVFTTRHYMSSAYFSPPKGIFKKTQDLQTCLTFITSIKNSGMKNILFGNHFFTAFKRENPSTFNNWPAQNTSCYSLSLSQRRWKLAFWTVGRARSRSLWSHTQASSNQAVSPLLLLLWMEPYDMVSHTIKFLCSLHIQFCWERTNTPLKASWPWTL